MGEIGNKNALKHGVYAIRDHGEAAMTNEQRSTKQAMLEQITTKEGAEDALRELCVDALILSKVAQSAVIKEHQAGVPLNNIPLARALPAFQNSAARILTAYLSTLDKEAASKCQTLDELLGKVTDDKET